MFIVTHRELREYENIGYQEDHWHTIIRSIPEDSEDFKKVIIMSHDYMNM